VFVKFDSHDSEVIGAIDLYNQHVFIEPPIHWLQQASPSMLKLACNCVLSRAGSTLLPPTQRLHGEVLIKHRDYFAFTSPLLLCN
jgi:hypothetical protein